jgi:polyhydroxybutyrate depolymerase
VRTWNAGGCCGYAAEQDVDDPGFIAALLDRVEQSLCIDRARVHVMGMSNGAMLAYRLACDLSTRVAAAGIVAGSDMTASCRPTRPVSVMHVHGTEDHNVPWDGGEGCGAANVAFRSVETSVAGWAERGACKGPPSPFLEAGDGSCERRGACPADTEVVLCAIDGGGHVWPGGEPPAGSGFPDCPFGAQSTTFDATRILYEFFTRHPLR